MDQCCKELVDVADNSEVADSCWCRFPALLGASGGGDGSRNEKLERTWPITLVNVDGLSRDGVEEAASEGSRGS